MFGAKPIITIPDYKIYKVDKHTPELQELERKLAEKGLKDPWIRNEVWRYDMRERLTNFRGGTLLSITRGFIPGVILGGVCALIWWQYDEHVLKPKHHHGDHH